MRFLKLLLVATVCLCFSVSAYANPGRTDSNGGHTDRDTGEYHYHHGYQAHQHSDMDGDGELDCPYDFVDKTGESSGSHNSSIQDQYYSSQDSKKPTEKTEPSTEPTRYSTNSEEKPKTENQASEGTTADCLMLVVLFASLAVIYFCKAKK